MESLVTVGQGEGIIPGQYETGQRHGEGLRDITQKPAQTVGLLGSSGGVAPPISCVFVECRNRNMLHS